MCYESFASEGDFDSWIYKETDDIVKQKNFKCEITNRKQAREYANRSLELIKSPKLKEDSNTIYFEEELKWLKRELKSMSGSWCYERIYIMYLLVKRIEKEKKS